MLQITEQHAAGLASRWPTAHKRGDPRREASSPESGLSNLLLEFLGRLSSADLDLDYGSAT
ncbi:hypothetical protein CQ10_18465 [Bradyrhizobium valentinum]|uniref:Uncharacterized protein n=1 Tax=Bradyrhizobium valentinum TaxID=1518501 RepID=A0A0R3LRL1_9BRAD|nr:hypothetical protein CQ10_18465 [Bradyrhizobium valentinum]KRR07843.1 hypothetical protein CP49_07455 [Bradyrhizobium valentinum]